jgi:hypothetical protein
MDVGTFFRLYPDEQSCKAFFKEKRAQDYKCCKRCGSLQLRWEEYSSRWRCKECKQTMSLKQGTVMENSNLGYKVWLWGLYLMSLTKKGFSALEVQRLTGHKRYEPIWLMMHKVRICMGQRDNGYTLDGHIEMDEGFFEGYRKKDSEGNPAQELDRQVKAVVAVSNRPVAEDEQKKHRPKTKAGYVKIQVVKSLSNKDVGYEARKMVATTASVITDGKPCYNTLKSICATHEKIIISDKKEVSKVFPWVHIAISNAKKKLLGLHHHVKDEYMQNYLNEFCYKFNRRFFGQALFDRLIVATLSNSWFKPNCG